MSQAKPKFLVLHPDPTNLNELVKKINAQNSKIGPFAAVILLCNVNPLDTKNVPDVTVYYMSDQQVNENDRIESSDLSSKFVSVKPMSIHKLHCGISMAFADTQHKDLVKNTPLESEENVDFLFSFHWPHAIAAGQKLTLVGNRNLDLIVRSLCPRYHFAVGTETGRYFENPHFSWNDARAYRFISLGREKSGSKWFYAFALNLESDQPIRDQPNPFLKTIDCNPSDASRNALKRGSVDELQVQSMHREDHSKSDVVPMSDAVPPMRKRPKISPELCFFCLSNPKVETHMIVAIGKHSYLTIAKGPLTLPTKALDLSGHGILIPIEHSPTASLPQETIEELLAFQTSLASAFGKIGHSVVFFEISRPENVHFHIQMVPIPNDMIEGFDRALEAKVQINNDKFVNNQTLKFQKFTSEENDLKQLITQPYVRFSIWENLHFLRCYLSLVAGDKALDLQFPRRVLAYLLRMPKRQNWDRCRQSISQETSECSKFKKLYEEFDVTRT